MMNKLSLASTALMAIAFAAPTPQSVGGAAGTTVANFEDGLPLLSIEPELVVSGIYWKGMSITRTGGIQNTVIVEPNSPKNYLSYGKLNLVTLAQGQPSMKAVYQGSTTNFFTLVDFYYGCSIGTPVSIAAVPANCTVTIKGYADDDGNIPNAEQSFTYSVPLLNTNSEMVLATVSTAFSKMKRVDFFVSGLLGDITPYSHIDTIRYVING